MSDPNRRVLEIDYSSDTHLLSSLGGAPLNDDSGDDHQVTDSDDDDLDDKPIGVTPSAPGVHPISSHSVGHSDSNPSGNNENEDLDERPVN